MNQKRLLHNILYIFANIFHQIEPLCLWKYYYFQAIVLQLLKYQCSLLWSYLIKIWKVTETRLTVTCMIAMMYHEAVKHRDCFLSFIIWTTSTKATLINHDILPIPHMQRSFTTWYLQSNSRFPALSTFTFIRTDLLHAKRAQNDEYA